MPKIARELSALAVKGLRHQGSNGRKLFSVGGAQGLYLQISKNGARSWILRIKIGAIRSDIGLGSEKDISLSDAREKARSVRKEFLKANEEGRDPLKERQEKRRERNRPKSKDTTLVNVIQDYLSSMIDAESAKLSTKSRTQWRSTLETYIVPKLGRYPVSSITNEHVLEVIRPIWNDKRETARRTLQRVERVLDWATIQKMRTGDNPARWDGNLSALLPAAKGRADKEHQPAVSLADAPRWWRHLDTMPGQGALALRLAVLCASRSGEIRGLTWGEIEFENNEPYRIAIPRKRMKADKDHVVPLSAAAIAILNEAARLAGIENWDDVQRDALVFPAPRGGQLSDMTLSSVMRRMQEAEEAAGRRGYLDAQSGRSAVPHGCRSTFRDWAGRQGYPRDLAEEALAHTVGNAVEAAYARTQRSEQRRPMMEEWAKFLFSDTSPSNRTSHNNFSPTNNQSHAPKKGKKSESQRQKEPKLAEAEDNDFFATIQDGEKQLDPEKYANRGEKKLSFTKAVQWSETYQNDFTLIGREETLDQEIIDIVTTAVRKANTKRKLSKWDNIWIQYGKNQVRGENISPMNSKELASRIHDCLVYYQSEIIAEHFGLNISRNDETLRLQDIENSAFDVMAGAAQLSDKNKKRSPKRYKTFKNRFHSKTSSRLFEKLKHLKQDETLDDIASQIARYAGAIKTTKDIDLKAPEKTGILTTQIERERLVAVLLYADAIISGLQ